MTTYTPSQAATALRVSRNRIMAWIRAGQLAASNLAEGGSPRYRITQAAIDDLLERKAVKPAAKKVLRRIATRTTENFFE